MGDDTHVAELELLRAQRAQLAGRLKAPWWYVAGSAVVLAVAFAMPIGSHYVTDAGIGGVLLAVLVCFVLQCALTRVSGVDVGMQTWRYPSGRAWTIAMIMLIFGASAAETTLLDRGLLAAAILVGMLATLAGTGFWQGHLRGIRQDLRTGRVPT